MTMRVSAISAALVVMAAGLANAGCGGACVEKGDQIAVELVAGNDLNDTGAGAQQAPFRLWAVSKAGVFQSMKVEDLCREDPSPVAAQKVAQPFATANWIAPGQTVKALHEAETEGQFTHLAVTTMIPQPVMKLVPLDCKGYEKADKQHKIRLEIRNKDVVVGDGKSKE